MATLTRFEDIEAWQLGRELKRSIYTSSRKVDFSRDYALQDQIRRAAISVTANIAEGFGRGGNREFIQFSSNSKGSCAEIQVHLYTALDEAHVTESEFQKLYEQASVAGRMIGAFMNYLQRSEIRGQKFRTPAK